MVSNEPPRPQAPQQARTQRAGIPNTQFRDLRAKALTDVDERSGIIAAQRMGAHSTQAQTADYIRNNKAIKSTATR